jgi:D-methionine transport system ATP-binding protein
MIDFIDISKKFWVKQQQIMALQHVSLQIDKGDIFGVIGFSGAGKSTLLRMVNALEVPTCGRVEINGQDINKLPFSKLRSVRKHIGMVFQQFNLLESKTVYDNIAIPLILNKVDKKRISQRVADLLAFVELSDKSNVYPAQLSGGQKQRVGIARALAMNPSILLCDEATSALDPETTESILKLLERINREMNITILVVTHEIHVIQRICNRVAVMEKGHLVETGSVLDVFSNPQKMMTRRFVQAVIPEAMSQQTVDK